MLALGSVVILVFDHGSQRRHRSSSPSKRWHYIEDGDRAAGSTMRLRHDVEEVLWPGRAPWPGRRVGIPTYCTPRVRRVRARGVRFAATTGSLAVGRGREDQQENYVAYQPEAHPGRGIHIGGGWGPHNNLMLPRRRRLDMES